MTLFQSLTHRSFVLLWSGQTISRLGDSLSGIALAWWVLQKTGSATAMGTVLIFGQVPHLLFLLVGGVAVDRFPRARVMLFSDSMSCIVMAAVALFAFAQRLEIWHVYLLSILFGFMGAFFGPAYMALLPEIVPREALPSANSLTGLSGQITGVVGPALGASFVALGGTPTAFALDALSFLISAICLVPLATFAMPPVQPSQSSNVIRDLWEGVALVGRTPWLWITIALAAFGNMGAAGALGVALPFLVKGKLHADVSLLGLLYSVVSLGAVLGAVWLGRFKRMRGRGLTAYGAWIVASLMLVVMGLAMPVVVIIFAAFVIGLCLSLFGLIWLNTMQELVPREFLGRVASIDSLGSFVLLPVGFGIVGWATDQFSASLVFVIGGVLNTALALLGLAHPGIRNLD